MTNPAPQPDTPAEISGREIPAMWRWLLLFFGIGVLVVVFFWSDLKTAWLVYRAHGLIENVQFADAEPLLQTATESSPDDIDAKLLLASVQRQQAHLSAARQTLSTIESVPGQPKRMRHERLLITARSGQIAAAEPWLPELLANDHLDARDVCEAFVVGYRINLNPPAALTLLDAWEGDWPNDYRTNAQRGLLAMMMSDWKMAVDEFQKAIFKGDKRAATNRRLGEAWLELNDAANAHKALKVAVNQDANSAAGWRSFARASEQLGQDADSLDAYKTALELDPVSFDAALGVARLELKNGQAQPAAEKLSNLLEQWPEDTATLFQYAQALNQLGQTEAAKDINTRWKAADKQIQLIEKLTEELKSNPIDIDLREQVGVLLMKHYSRRMGLEYLTSVLMTAPGKSETHQVLARFYETTQQPERAKFHREKVTSTVPVLDSSK